MLASIKQKIKLLSQPNNLLIVVVILLSLAPILGLGFKNTILSGALLVILTLVINPKFEYTISKGAYLIATFLALFTFTQFYRQTPYGFHEFINLGLGAFTCLVLIQENFKLKYLSKALLFLTSTYSLFSIFYLIFSSTDRAFGVFFGAEPYTTYPNAFADLLIISTSLYVANMVSEKILKFKKLDLGLLFISLTGFWLTFSRGAYLSLALSLGMFFIIYILQHKQNFKDIIKKGLILLSVSLVSLVSSVAIGSFAEYSSSLSDRIQSSDPASIRSASERPTLWQGALEITKEYPLFGSGSGSFEFVYPRLQNSLLSNAPHPHSLLLKLLSENGLIVFSIFTALLLYAYRPSNFQNNLPVLTAFTGINIHFLLDYNLNFPILAFLYFFLLSQLLTEKTTVLPLKSRFLKYFSFTFTAIFSVTIFTQFYGYYHIKQLENTPDLPSYHLSLAKIAPFEHQLYSLVDYPIQTDKYPDFHPNLYVKTLAERNLKQKFKNSQKLLQLNYYNDLNYHYLFLLSAYEASEQDAIQEFEPQAYILIQDYIDLLRLNTHNTVTSDNPSASLKIIQFYQEHGSNSWDKLEKDLISVYKTERNKFQARFNYNLPDLNE